MSYFPVCCFMITCIKKKKDFCIFKHNFARSAYKCSSCHTDWQRHIHSASACWVNYLKPKLFFSWLHHVIKFNLFIHVLNNISYSILTGHSLPNLASIGTFSNWTSNKSLSCLQSNSWGTPSQAFFIGVAKWVHRKYWAVVIHKLVRNNVNMIVKEAHTNTLPIWLALQHFFSQQYLNVLSIWMWVRN